MGGIRRRELIGAGAAGVVGFALGPAFWRDALAATARAAASSYGALGAPDANGLRLPPGFTAREIARANQPVPGSAYPWHIFSDGQATFAQPGGGWVLVSNSESIAADGGGSSAIRFGPDGEIDAAYRILSGTHVNCAGGPAPWGAWLSCEERDYGLVWECDPGGPGQGVARPALGTFAHESVAVDPVGKRLYMTEDRPDGALYRFTPDDYPDLTRGLLEVAVGPAGGGSLTWEPVPDPAAVIPPTRSQVAGTRRFNGGEGMWFDSGTVYFATKGDNRIWAYETATGALATIYDRAAAGANAPLSGVDNLTVSRAGEVFVCEDGGDMQICVIGADRTVAPFLQLTGEAAEGLPDRGNELAGVVFDPSGERMYFASQRGYGFGVVYEVTGPFAGGAAPEPTATPTATATATATATPTPTPTATPTPEPTRTSENRPQQPGPAPPGEPEPKRAPPVALTAPRSITIDRLRRRGLPVELRLEDVERFRLALRTDDLAREPGRRGSAARPRTVTLDRRIRRARPAMTQRLGITAREAARLRRRRSVGARLTLVAHHHDGRITVLTRTLTIRRGS